MFKRAFCGTSKPHIGQQRGRFCAAGFLLFFGLFFPSFHVNAEGLFGRNNTYDVSIRIVQCRMDDGLPEGLPGLPPPQSHPACAQFEAHILAEVELKLKPGQKKIWQEVKTIPVQRQNYEPLLEKGIFNLHQKTEQGPELKAGVELEAYLDTVEKNKATLALFVRHLSIKTNGEEMLLHSSGRVLLNPQARQVERLSTFYIKTPLDEEEIWGGESVIRAPAAEEVPKVFPEHGRLWAEVLIGH